MGGKLQKTILFGAVLIGTGLLAELGFAAPPIDPPSVSRPGAPFLESYSTRDQGFHDQNWAIVQDRRGVLYFGNTIGVLEYDGAHWHQIPITNTSIARSLAIGEDGTIYVGAVGELGYLEPLATGEMHYVSLLEHLPPEHRDFGDIWRTFATSDGVFFWSPGRFFHWHDGRFDVLETATDRAPDVVLGSLFHHRHGVGLSIFRDGAFVPLPGTEALPEIRVVTILPYPGDALLLGTRESGFFIAEPVPDSSRYTIRRFETEVDAVLREYRLYQAVRLEDGTYALGTMSGGAVGIDAAGRKLWVLDKSRGLLDDSVWFLHVDLEGGLWLALNRGISRVEIQTPITTFGEPAGLQGTVEALARHGGRLFAATGSGLFARAENRFLKIPGVGSPCWSLLSAETADGRRELLVGGYDGVYALSGDTVDPGATDLGFEIRRLAESQNAFALAAAEEPAGLVYVGEGEGLRILAAEAGTWTDRGQVDGISDEIRSILVDAPGDLWLSTHWNGILRVRFDSTGLGAARIDRFAEDEGLSDLNSVKAHRVDGHLLASTTHGLLELDAEAGRFGPGAFVPERHAGRSTSRLVTRPEGGFWISFFNGGVDAATQLGDRAAIFDTAPLKRLRQETIFAMLVEPGNVAWLGGPNGLFRFEPGNGRRAPADVPPTRIDRVTSLPTASEDVSGDGAAPPAPESRASGAVLPFGESSLVFTFALPFFDGRSANVFSHRLDGYDEEWSSWSTETKKEYTSLSEGDYQFRVRGRNIYGEVAPEASFRFTVLPPWYRTIWAYLAYAALAGLFVYGTGRWRSRRIERERDLLESRRAALEREIEARQAAEEDRERLVAELEAKNEELERFTYTVSHDLRSPLLTIRGFAGYLEKDLEDDDRERIARDLAEIVSATAKMQGLIEDLLELSRAGQLVGSPVTIDLGELVQDALDNVAGPIEEKGVEVVVAPDLPEVSGDRTRLFQVFQNLIHNAVKFTGDAAHPRVEIDARQVGEHIECTVRDNGQGIDPRYRSRIFDLFEKLDADKSLAGTDADEGTGVGLALVERIVSAHGGRVWVESDGPGQGSTFRFTLPRRR